jgi:hypothetical protein
MNIDIEKCHSTLLSLNRELHKKCGNALTIQFGNYDQLIREKEYVSLYDDQSNDYQLLLCLSKHNDCIASISCKINSTDGSMEISSKTDPLYEGRKYNLLLRCAIILLAPHIFYTDTKSIITIVSRAINPISILLMAKYFRATNDVLNQFIANNGLQFETLTFDDMQTFYNELNEMPEFETEDDELMYLLQNESFGNPVLLYIHVNDIDVIDKTQQLFSEMVIRCPNTTRTGGKKKTKTSKNKSKRRMRKTNKRK